MKKFLFIFASVFAASLAQSQPASNDGRMYWKSVSCRGVKADLMVNHRTVAQPTLFLNSKAIKLENGLDYSGPVCVNYQGEYKVGITASMGMGNAGAWYTIYDLDTFKPTEISYSVANKIGFFK